MSEFHYIGKPTIRVDAFEKVTGTAMFMQDMEVPGALHGRFLYSPYAHAKIKRIVTDKAEKVAGVAAVVTHKDLPPKMDEVSGLEPGYMLQKTEASPYLFRGWGLQRDGIVRCMGSPVAAVAARTEEAADKALDLIEIEYEPLPVVIDPEEAIKPGAPQLYTDVPNNIILDWTNEIGDIEKGFKEADLVYDEVGETQPQSHLSPDPRGAIAWWEGEKPVVCISTMCSYPALLRGVASAFGLPESKVRIYGPPYMGSCYGGRAFNEASFALIVMLLARKSGKPVKVSLTREEDILALARCSSRLYVKIGFKRDGTITAIDYRAYINPGPWWYPAWIWRYQTHLFKVIRCDNIRAHTIQAATNIPFSGGPFRGFAYMEAFAVTQPILRKIANDLGLDYLKLLQKHIWRGGELVPQGRGFPSLMFSSSGIDEAAFDKGKSLIGWEDKREPDEYVGVGYCVSGSTQFPSNIDLRMNRDGSIQLETGVMELGSGQYTTLTLMAAEAIGASPDVINITHSFDTQSQPWEGGQRSERTTFGAGLAIQNAAKNLRQQIFVLVSKRLDVRPEELELENGVVFVKTDPEKKMPLSAIGLPVIASGTFEPDFKNIPWANGPIACFAKIKIDRETGLITPTKLVMLNDVGRAINPPVVHTQNMGTLSGGLGFALTESIIFDKDGRALNANPAYYFSPTILDIPEFHSEIIEPIDKAGPFGAKGAGEKVLTPSGLAVSAAVFDALKTRINTPFTPDKVLKALRK
ncbi:xanthine dehydrogenase family protein molybdopterin-binding subunit [Chloroflexota bacterium]